MAQDPGCGQQLFHLRDGEDVGNPGCFGRLDQGDVFPGFVQCPGIEELQAIELYFDRAPGMRVQEFHEIVEQLTGVEIANPAVEIIADTPDRLGVGV